MGTINLWLIGILYRTFYEIVPVNRLTAIFYRISFKVLHPNSVRYTFEIALGSDRLDGYSLIIILRLPRNLRIYHMISGIRIFN